MHDKIRTWLENSDRPVGAVVHTLDGKKAIRAERTADGWVLTYEKWDEHS